jgi:hypothetical protein
MRMSFSSLSSSRNGLPTVRQLMGSSSIRLQVASNVSRNPSVVMRGRFNVCDIFEPYRGQHQDIKKIERLVDRVKLSSIHARHNTYTGSKTSPTRQPIGGNPLFKKPNVATTAGLQQFHTLPRCYREVTPLSEDNREIDMSSE